MFVSFFRVLQKWKKNNFVEVTCKLKMKARLNFWGSLEWQNQSCVLITNLNIILYAHFSTIHVWTSVCTYISGEFEKTYFFFILLGLFHSNELCKTTLSGILKLLVFFFSKLKYALLFYTKNHFTYLSS